jgi:PAS domain S-box-containing protein
MRSESFSSSESELHTILEGIGEGFYAVDRDWRIRHYNSEAARHFGRPAEEMIGRVLWELFPAARDTALGRTFVQVMESRQPLRSESPSVLFDGRWLAYRLFPVGDGIGVVFRDVSDRKRAEQQRDLLMAELSHRVKNTLSLVQAIAAQTLREIDPALRSSFEARLIALGTAQSMLTEKNWSSADLHDVVASITDPHRPQDAARLAFAGPHLRLNPQSAVAFSLALHELCTNALKYGAWSSERGRVEIRWRIVEDRLSFHWHEEGGPPVRAPMRKGFGSRMIESLLPAQIRGEARIDYDVGGLRYVIAAPLDAVSDAPARKAAGAA